MRGESALLLWNDYLGSDEAAFHEWYNRRHIPERVPRLPGFLRARRFAALQGGPRYIALYDLQTAAALETPQYRALLDNLDHESRHFVPKFGHASKTILSVVARAGHGEGAALAAFGLGADAALLPQPRCRERVARLIEREGIVAAHVMRLDAAAMAAARPTRPDDLALPWVLLIEATSAEVLTGLQADDCLGVPRGTTTTLREGVFGLIFASLP